MFNEVTARLVYGEGADVWTRGVEHFLDVQDFTDHITRNKERILWVSITQD